jgi:hypothetical protein
MARSGNGSVVRLRRGIGSRAIKHETSESSGRGSKFESNYARDHCLRRVATNPSLNNNFDQFDETSGSAPHQRSPRRSSDDDVHGWQLKLRPLGLSDWCPQAWPNDDNVGNPKDRFAKDGPNAIAVFLARAYGGGVVV